MIVRIIHLLFKCYTIMLFLRIFGSWLPQLRDHKIMRFFAHYTDPYLQVFRRLIPPIGGTFDLSPVLGFFALSFLEKIVLAFFR